MTAIANWINKEFIGAIWTIGDTKISDLSTNTNLSLESSKVFELQILCKDITAHPNHRDIYYKHSIGFAFAGSSLVGLNCYATLNTMLSNLGGGRNQIPDMKNISTIVAKIVDYYCKSICFDGNNFEALLYGFCHKNRKLMRFHISKQITDNDVIYREKEITDESLIVILGDKKEEILEEIKIAMEAQEDKSTHRYWRTPLRVLNEIILSKKYETIGGGTQLNLADLTGCRPCQSSGSQDMKFRNIDIYQDIGHYVGECIVAIDGMNFDI